MWARLKTPTFDDDKSHGFTIVELLIVIVVIGILVTITIVTYNGLQDKATAVAVKSDIKAASNQLDQDNAIDGSYPASKESANSGNGLKSSEGTNFEYSYVAADNSYCLTATSNRTNVPAYRISSANGTIEQGVCPGHLDPSIPDTGAYAWTELTTAGSRTWSSVAMSDDGTKLVASVNNGYLYTSIDSGATWTQRTAPGNRAWSSVTSSADGVRLAASVRSGRILTSQDSGATWIERMGVSINNWQQVASSADGLRLVAVGGCTPTMSTDGGANWSVISNASCLDWRVVSVSAAGTTILMGAWDGSIKYSTNSGGSWTAFRGGEAWNDPKVVVTRDASRYAIGAGNLAVTANSGTSWDSAWFAWAGWSSIAASADGHKIVNAIPSNNLKTYVDGTSAFVDETRSGPRNWSTTAISADGQKIVAGVNGGYLYRGLQR